MKKVALIMGSISDWEKVKPAVETLVAWGVPYEAHVFSAHRSPEEAKAFTKQARQEGYGVILAAAGMAAHLAGSIAASTTLPVIGIPIEGKHFSGMDALLSTVQMPPGIPVATVAVNGAKNAALLAIQILGVTDEALAQALEEDRELMRQGVLDKDRALQEKLQELS